MILLSRVTTDKNNNIIVVFDFCEPQMGGRFVSVQVDHRLQVIGWETGRGFY